jgi:hypothetical protein
VQSYSRALLLVEKEKKRKRKEKVKYRIAVSVLGFAATEIWYSKSKSMVHCFSFHVSLEELATFYSVR